MQNDVMIIVVWLLGLYEKRLKVDKNTRNVQNSPKDWIFYTTLKIILP